MRRFSRKRRGGNRESQERQIDAEHWLGRLREVDAIPDLGFAAWAGSDVPPHLAVVARGTGEEGASKVVCFAPTEAGDALIAALATGAKLVEEESFAGEVMAIAPNWSIQARRRLGLVKADLPYTLKTLSLPELGEIREGVESESDLEPAAIAASTLASSLVDPGQRALFTRAVQGLQGLSAKHGGAIRSFGQQVELIVAARRVAELRLEAEQPVMTTWGQQKSTVRITAQNVAGALDDLEGQVRRRLNDRKIREGEEGLRARALPLLIATAQLRDAVAWPLGGSDEETVDLVGLRKDGTPVAGAIRKELTLASLGGFMDGLQKLRLAQNHLFAGAEAPVQLRRPDLVIAAETFAPSALKAMAGFAAQSELLQVAEDKEKGLNLSSIGIEEAARSIQDKREEQARSSRRPRKRPSGSQTEAADAEKTVAEATDEGTESNTQGGDRGRGRRRSRRRGRGRSDDTPASEDSSEKTQAQGEEKRSFDEISLFELGEPEESTEPKRKRSRGRRGGRDSAKASESEGGGAKPESDKSSGGEAPGAEESGDLIAEGFDELADLPPSLEEAGRPALAAYEDDDASESAEAEESDKPAGLGLSKPAPPPVEEAPKPRRRAVIVAAADRDSISAAILLARDVRLLEGIWIYPQSELMHFFREVTTDLKEDVPIHLVGFSPSPAGEVLQAVSLYPGQINWYDHHEWPPEDLFALEKSIGEESLHYMRGAGSSVPAVLATSTRRSRFSDKLVDLIAGRFTQHDYERWGRLWWWRLGQIAGQSGDVRRDIEGLLAGRPSDLAREAGRVDAPPIPDEVQWVSTRDFRLVHFAGYVMVVVEAEVGIDPHLAGRIARERYDAQLSITRHEGGSLFLVTGDDHTAKRALDYAGLAQHLAEKLAWVNTLESQDHVARFVIDGLEENPERLEEVITEIAMGRSTLER